MAAQGKMEALNDAIRESIPHMRAVALENPQVTVYVNAIRFGDDARWLVERLIPVSDFRWGGCRGRRRDRAGGGAHHGRQRPATALIRLRALPPLLALVTDGPADGRF